MIRNLLDNVGTVDHIALGQYHFPFAVLLDLDPDGDLCLLLLGEELEEAEIGEEVTMELEFVLSDSLDNPRKRLSIYEPYFTSLCALYRTVANLVIQQSKLAHSHPALQLLYLHPEHHYREGSLFKNEEGVPWLPLLDDNGTHLDNCGFQAITDDAGFSRLQLEDLELLLHTPVQEFIINRHLIAISFRERRLPLHGAFPLVRSDHNVLLLLMPLLMALILFRKR